MADLERTQHKLEKEKREMSMDSTLLWFLERAFKRMSPTLRSKDRDLIEASAPAFITPEVIKWEEMKRNMAGANSS